MAWASALSAAFGIIPGIIQAAEKPRVAKLPKPKQSAESRADFALAQGREDTILTRTGRAPLGGGGSVPPIANAA